METMNQIIADGPQAPNKLETESQEPKKISKRRSGTTIPDAGLAAIDRTVFIVNGCEQCELHEGCKVNCADGYGGKPCKVLIVFENADLADPARIPGLLRQAISAAKIPSEYIRYTSAIRCIHHGLVKHSYENAKACRNHLLNEIAELNPKVILTIGEFASYSLTGQKNKTNYNSIHQMDDGRYRINLYPTLNAVLNNKLRAELFSSLKKVNNLVEDITYPPNAKYILVQTDEQLELARKILLQTDLLVFDFETGTDLNKDTNTFAPEDTLLCCGFSWGPDRGICIPLDHPENTLDKAKCHQLVKDILRSDIPKIAHNEIYDRYAAYHFYNGLETKNVVFDTMLAHHTLDPTQKTHSLKYLVGLFTPFGGYEQILDKYKIGPDGTANYKWVPLEILAKYCNVDVDMTFRLYQKFKPELEAKPKLNRLFKKLTMPSSDVFYEIRKTGMVCNKEKLLAIRDYYDDKLRTALSDLYENPYVLEHAPDLNIGSSKQLQDLLYGKLNLRVVKKTAKGGNPSTDEESINRLAALYKKDEAIQPLLDAILDIRKCNKFIGTYIDGLIPHINEGRVYTTYLLHGTTSGRPTSINPNLLNLPSEDEKDTVLEQHIKTAFEAPPGYLFVSADYSQIELRNIGNETGEPELVDAYLADEDMHAKTASIIFGIPINAIQDYQRKIGKTTNFGGAYGAGYKTLAAQIEKTGNLSDVELLDAMKSIGIYHNHKADSLTADERNALMEKLAKHIQKMLFQKWSTFGSWQRRVRAFATSEAMIHSRFGRTRYLHFVPNEEKWKLVNTSVNYPIQSVSSDCLMLAMIRINDEFKKRKMKSHIVGQVYDSINYYVHESEKDFALSLIKTVMECEPLLYDREYFTVPMRVDIAVGPNWGQLEKVKDIKYIGGIYE